MSRYLTVLVLLFCAHLGLAQTGTIKGTIKDAKTQEAIIGASAVIEGTTIGAATDIDGKFIIPKVPAGTHTLIISFVSYQKKTIPNLVIEAGKATVINTALDEESTALSEVTITAQRVTNTEVAVISEIRAAQQVAVGISSQQITKSQDRDAAQIARRVPGVSIVDNRFVIVRGLSQRYNAVMLNDVLAPSSEVDTRAFSFDMIPSNIIDRMLIFKSGAADLPGEFAGGVIKVYTKRAPEENFTSINLSGSYRANTTFKEVQKYEGSKTDFLGFDNGTRKIPNSYPNPFNNSASPEQRAALGNELPNTWGLTNKTVPLDLRLGFNMGRRFELGNITVGNLTSINYTNANQFANSTLNSYGDFNETNNITHKSQSYIDDAYQNNVRIGVLENLSFKWNNNHSIEFKNLFNQLSFNETVVRNGQNIDENNDVLSYSERFESRSIYSGQLVGKHKYNEEKTNIDWQLGFAYTGRQEPDWKRARYQRTTGAFQSDGKPEDFRLALPGTPSPIDVSRFFSKLNEKVWTAAANLEQQLGRVDSSAKEPIKLKVGFYTESKDRHFDARILGYEGIGNTSSITSQPIGQIFSSQNVTGANGAFSFQEAVRPSNSYSATNTLLAGYASIFIPLGSKVNATVGFRGEYNDQAIKSHLYDGSPVNEVKQIFSPLPSLNVAYNITDKALLRAAYFRSVNRPEFRERAPFAYYDFNMNSTVVGNYTLTTATIDNVDVRWEYYPAAGELISLGGFYKSFQNPIESFLLTTGGASSLNYTYVNSKSAQSYGAEFEIRKSLTELSSSKFIQNLSLVANASYIYTKVDLGDSLQVPDLGGAIKTINVGTFQDKIRPMVNQSPYLINVGLYYNDESTGWQVNILYNVSGKRLFAVGSQENPSIYEMPRNILDLTLTKTINKKFEIRAGVQDLLNNQVRLVQDNNQDGKITGLDNDIRTFRRGAYFTLGFNYNF
jgi:TonB-dependent receptor